MNDSPEAHPEIDVALTDSSIFQSETKSDKPSRMRRALILSLTVHAILLLVLLFLYLPKEDVTAKAASSAVGASAERLADRPEMAARSPSPSLLASEPADDVPDEQIRKSIESQIESARKVPDEVKLSELEKNMQRLNSIASEESVNQITSKIGSSLGLETQTYQPKTDIPEGRFDFNTAQLTDVKRKKGKEGNWIYDATLVDSEGRTSQARIIRSRR